VRTFVTSLFALILSGLAGGLVAMWLAIATNADSEYILVFMLSALVTIILTVVFFIAQFMSDPQRAVNLTALVAVAFFVAIGIGLIAWTFSQPPGKAQWSGDLRFGAGLVLPGIATVLVQWLFVGWRVRRGLKAEAGA
jgi:heme/copper-type cytochrome/quinol oxidase subunit 4